MHRSHLRNSTVCLATAALLGLSLAGTACSKSAATSQDDVLTQAVEAKLNADPALQGDNLTAVTQNGVVTLSGSVPSEAARTSAAQDAQVPGVTQVNNEIATHLAAAPAAASAAVTPSAPPAAAPSAPASRSRRRTREARATTAPATRAAAAPVAPATVEIDAGQPLSVRLSQALSSSSAHAGDTWQGQIATAVRVNGQVAVPQGAAVSGTIVAADAAGHFRGSSRLVLQLESLQYNGASYRIASKQISKETAARGTRTAETVGGGAGVGALIGALAGHGKGAAIGAALGAGAGTATQAFTKAPEVNLPAETVLSFTLSAPLTVLPAASAH